MLASFEANKKAELGVAELIVAELRSCRGVPGQKGTYIYGGVLSKGSSVFFFVST